MKAIVVGGGLAGLSAALRLLDDGHEVTLLEARPTLGGVVQTLPKRGGDPDPPPDNGQHIALGCCEAYLDFLRRVGTEGSLDRRRLALPVIGEYGSVAVIGPGTLDLLRYGHVSLRDRFAIARVTRKLGTLVAEEHDDETFAALVRRLGQSDSAIDRFWDVFMRPALNLRSEEVSAAVAIFTVQIALLGERWASDVLLPTAPLGEMHGEAAGRALGEGGATVRLNARVVALDGDAATLADGERLEADAFVVAVPPAESAHLLGEDSLPLENSPIISVHLLFDRRILDMELAALLGSPAHWVFDRGRLTGNEPERGQYLTVVSSGTPELLSVRGKELVGLVAGEVTARLGAADLLWSRVSREPAATFAARPGLGRLRPDAATNRPNVTRAGAWTATGWPATMEGAVRSGATAAAVLGASLREKVVA